ncbi:hypothetical protein MGG_04163 [Pyricularia oryzae 70-15]|uniref:Folliculin-interacting protein N-terminal domain-containing protein n=1 Tax=Pyricularia oryzae (strain 70-15 / ATCC MYA-4617 / FGSC 8958) TaxID=242507 RepID=G4NIP2_PYRO7|nr:uncharacterized protein MGG_04163 [Pyricularia oryzae 70-15]EHA47298.1 hypothetical protein MGG_04163 [Pyricularia oryzae 70-15]
MRKPATKTEAVVTRKVTFHHNHTRLPGTAQTMLGKLFNLTAGNNGDDATGAQDQSSTSPSQLISTLESVQEDIHTRNLLFPDAESLFQHRNDQVFPLSAGPALPSTSTAVNSFDYDCDVFLDAQDVRVLIMQDALSAKPAALIYDSRPRPPPTSPVSDRPDRPPSVAGFATGPPPDVRRGPVSPRKSSMSQGSRPGNMTQDGSQPQRQSAFDRRASMHGRTQPRIESDTQRANREYADEINVFSSCIFGNSELMAYKGTSTKVHVVPTDGRNESSASFFGDGRGSLGRASMRSSKLSQSFSSEAVGDFMPQMSSSALPRTPQRKKVLITRLFPVTLPSDEASDLPITTPSSRFSEDSAGGFPFPQDGEDGKAKMKRPQPKQKRTPMYAVALVINLPQPTGGNGNGVSVSASRQGVFRGSSSYNENESFPSSFSSARRSGWTMVGQAAAIDSFESAYVGDIEDRIDPITQHWDIIMRTLTHLQSVVATKLSSMLRQHDIGSPDQIPSSLNSQLSRRPSVSRRRSDDGASTKAPKMNARYLTLHPNCLMDNHEVTREIEIAQARIVAGLRATRVVTGQNRWGIWREEARWVARWAGVKDQGLFFHSLLTGYLATHTDWLQALGPSFHRKRHQEQARARGDEDMSLPARTVIVARDKMAARRLVFLLAAFLPANQQLPISMRAHRPSTSASFGGPFSHSPPTYAVPILKEESLRRKINRRTAPRRLSHSRTVSLQAQPPTRSSGLPSQLAHLSMERGHERRPSDATSIRTTYLPISTSDSQNRKSSAATAATITPEATIPHFATLQRQESLSSRRPGSASSTAADDLKRTLQRGDSNLSTNSGSNSPAASEPRPSSSTWGVLAGLWNARRRGSRGSTDTSPPKRDSINSILSGPPMSPTKPTLRSHQEQLRSPARLTAEPKMSRAAGLTSAPDLVSREQRTEDSPGRRRTESPSTRESVSRSPRLSRLATLSDDGSEALLPPRRSDTFQRIPDPSGAFESPVKTSINISDGVIDVDVQFPEYITSFETAISSPSSSGYLSTPGGSGLELFEQTSRIAADGDQPFNVAGWLQQYHPDFILQAIPPQEDLIEQVKASLRAEPSPPVLYSPYHPMSAEAQQQERWLDVSSVIVADTTSFSIQRIRYRRLVKLKPFQDLSAGALLTTSSVNTHSPPVALLTPAVTPYETKLEEEFIIEPIVTLDDVLVEAVERVVGHVGLDSTSSSRSTSKRRERSNSDTAPSGEATSAIRHVAMPVGRAPKALQEVPRAECKMVILSALEEVIKEVVERRDREHREMDNDEHREKESELTVAVRGWLESVEMGE